MEQIYASARKKLNIGLVGCGIAAELHAKALAGVTDAKLAGAFAADRPQCEEFCKKYGLKSYKTLENLIDDESIDIIDICTPSGTHRSLAEQAMRAGKHVIVEKPLAMTEEECHQLLRIRDDTGRMLAPISQLRFSPDIRAVHDAVQSGKLGRLTLCSVYMKYYRKPEYYTASVWRGSRSMDGGALMNQGIHGIDLLRFLAGNARVLAGCTRTLGHPIESEGTSAALLEFESGAIGVIESCTTASPGYPRRIELCGMEGSLLFEEDSLKVCDVPGLNLCRETCTEEKSAGHRDPAAASTEGHRRQFEDIVRHLTEGTPLFYPAEEAAKTVELICAIQRAGQEKDHDL